MNTNKLIALLLLWGALLLGGCGPDEVVVVDEDWDWDRYVTLEIPYGQLPPPGECKFWYYRRPDGQQPPPHKCGSTNVVPAGAWLIHRVSKDTVRIHFWVDGVETIKVYRVE